MDSLLKKLGDLLAEEYTRLKGVRREIRFLRSELNSMNAVLQKCAAMESPDVQVKAWTRELRELAYDVEDCVDEFVHGVDTKQRRHGPRARGIKEFFRECARRLKALVTRHEIADQVQELKARVVEVAEQRVRYKLDEVSSSSPCIRATDPRLCALFPEESHLVGIDAPRDDLASWLLMEDELGRRKVLSIYGFGGLGKTTLANEVRRKIGKQFDCEAVVPVSQMPDDKKILWNILA
jgi:disease resistance protein RPM1